MMAKWITFITIITIIISIFTGVNFELWQNFRFTPAKTKYFGAIGYFFDYYQFLSWMRDGAVGKILINSRYIPDSEKPVLLHPFFTVLGSLGSKMGLSSPVTYHLARNILLAVFLGSIYLLVRRRDAFLLILIAGGVPTLAFQPLIDFWQTFYFLEKFNIPPHHLLSKSLFLILLLLVISKKKSIRRLVLIGLISVLLILVNPASMSFLLMVLGITTIILMAGDERQDPRIKILLIAIVSLPFFAYYDQIFNYGNPWRYYYYGEKVGRYLVSFWAYLGSLGPLFFTSLLSLFYIKKMELREKIMVVWNFLPILMFPFVGRQIPFSMSRLFSVDLFIPSSILTVYFFKSSTFSKKIKVLGICLLALGLFWGGLYSVSHVFSYKPSNFYNVFVPDTLLSAVDYINKNSKPASTILAGETISNFLPSVTDNHVVWGRLDAYSNYQAVREEVNSIYFRQVSDREIINLLRRWRVQYIIFGIDQVGYDRFVSGGKVEGIEEILRNGEIVIAEVK